MIELTQLSVQELENLRDACISEIQSRKPKNTFEFTFEATNDPRKGYPYVAKLTGLDTAGKFERVFKELDRTYGKKEVTVSGTYTALAGEILEIRTGGSWKNDYRDFYLVDEDGKLVELGLTSNSQLAAKIKKYMRGEIQLENLTAA